MQGLSVMAANQTPEQQARDHIDTMLVAAGWVVQTQKQLNLQASLGVAVTEVQTDAGIADYVLFVRGKPVGIIEAKREEEGQRLTQVEEQSASYAVSKIKHLKHQPLSFVYESTGVVTRFTDYRDPKPRSRPVFHFHRPETLTEWLGQSATLRARLQQIPELNTEALRPAQIRAIEQLEQSFKENRPRALIQMATGAGKTFTACTFVYRLLRYAQAKRVLFLVDTKKLGEQAEQEFLRFQPNDDNRKFTELYNVQRLRSSYIASDSQVCISTIQRLYSILKGEELDEAHEQDNPNETDNSWQKKAPLPLEYTPKNPIEQFDFIIIDECHRSIYNLWRQVLEYYDAFLIGLTATPDARTFGFFNQNVVSEYSFEESVADGVNVPYDVFLIETEITKQGATIAQQLIEKREKLSRKKRWEHLDDELAYKPSSLDKEVVNPSTIRLIINTFKRSLPAIFPDRFNTQGEFEVPKTLIFAKTDSHANDIIEVVRDEFAEGNDFCKKITYQADEDPKSVLNRFRNSWNPRIAVTVDMIATGTDVKPLEVLLFMRDVKSSNYFEQMKGRGTRSISFDDLQKVSQTAKHSKTHFVIMDAVGATKSRKTDSRPLERKPSTPLKDLLQAVAFGNTEEDLLTTLANRLIRLNKQLSPEEQAQIVKLSSTAQTLTPMIKQLLSAYDPDALEERTQAILAAQTVANEAEAMTQAQEELAQMAVQPFNAALNDFLSKVQTAHEQVMDTVNLDSLHFADWDKSATENARQIVQSFEAYLLAHRDEITALQIFYNQPYRRRELSFAMIQALYEQLQRDQPRLSPHYVWEAYSQLDKSTAPKPEQALVALVSLLRRVTGLDQQLTPFNEQVNRNFQRWILQQNAGQPTKFSAEQMDWLRMMRDHVASSFHVELDDLDYTPFDGLGGRGKMWQLFGDQMQAIMDELNEVLVA